MEKRRLTLTLRTRLLLLIAATGIPLCGLIGYSIWTDRTAAHAEAQRQTRQLARFIAEEQNRAIEQSRQLMQLLSNVPVVRDPSVFSQCAETFQRILKQSPMYGNLGVADARGNMLCSALPFKPGFNVADRSWFQRALESRRFAVGDYLIGRLSGVPSLTLSYPLLDERGQVQKVLFAAIDLNWLRTLSQQLSLPAGTALVLVDAQGTVLLRHPDPHKEWTGQRERDEVTKAMLASDCRGYREFPGLDGVVRLNAIEPLQKLAEGCVYVRVGVPKADIYAPIDLRLQRYAVAAAAMVFLMFLVAWLGSDALVLRPVLALTRTAQRLGRGDLSARTGLRHDEEEFGQLARTFDDMAAGLQDREASLIRADRALARANRALTVLSAGNHTMLRAVEEQALLSAMCRMIVDKAGYATAWVGYELEEGGGLEVVAHASLGGSNAMRFPLDGESDVGGIEHAVRGAVHQERTSVVTGNAGKLIPSAWFGDAGISGLSACAVLPLQLGDERSGVLCICATDPDAFDEAEMTLLKEAAADLCFGIARLRDQARRRNAENASRIKSEFLANMSHELRTPLNAIIGFSEVMKDGLVGQLTAEQQEYITDIFVSGRHLLSLINDILDLSKVEAGKMVLDLESADLGALLENSLSVVREKAVAHGIQLRQELVTAPGALQLDVRKTKQIVYNLLSNAVKFTPDGGVVTLRACRVSRSQVENWTSGRSNAMRLPLAASPHGDGDGDFLEISVEDTGIGIKPEDAPRLFQPFSQVDSSLARRFEGTGLGLAMVMKMAELHGGTVAVESEPGEGSRFIVWLPWRQGAEPGVAASHALPEPERTIAGMPGRVALVVEDDDAAAELMRRQLEAEAVTVVRVASAEEALALMSSQRPSVIVLDILLPGMDGWAFLDRIKQPDSPWSGVPVVITSIAPDSKRGMALGAAHMLQKPVAREELVDTLRSLGLLPLNRNGCKVAVVDDDPAAVQLLCAYLTEAGCKPVCAYGGRQGVEMVARERPDLLILDLVMPDMSGFDVVAAIRGSEQARRTPIVIVTARSLGQEDRALLLGQVSAIYEKADFDSAQFAAEVRQILAVREGVSP